MAVRKRSNRDHETGSTYVELLVVTVVIAIVATLAIIQLAAPRNQFSRQNVSRELKVALERARFDSVKRRAAAANAFARVVISPTSYTVGIDRDKNGIIEASDNWTTSFAGTPITITGSGMTFPVTLTYDQRGEVIATDASSTVVSPVFRICNGSCSPPTNANSDLLLVTPTGTVNLLSGNSSVPAFATPAVTAISSDTNVNPMVTVP